MSEESIFSVVALGQGGVGKSNLYYRFVTGHFSEEEGDPTLGMFDYGNCIGSMVIDRR
jgi:GTPase SAR1 family protein